MMHDSLDPRDLSHETAADVRPAASAEPFTADREVPLDSATLPTSVHAWLDGELVNEDALSSAEPQVALWRRIGDETGRRRRMATPAHVPAQIMAKIAES